MPDVLQTDQATCFDVGSDSPVGVNVCTLFASGAGPTFLETCPVSRRGLAQGLKMRHLPQDFLSVSPTITQSATFEESLDSAQFYERVAGSADRFAYGNRVLVDS